ncbi:hypothetical protein F53441_935 [Fusarium austroafricanum]|uniref:Uncharacterized protein n=1 Tax=Fusarium austroafricanum TaxID=2364996 RepID=A0A8H4KWQ4_9HYPO|nr:hypothetical protein F53441_935 [Fusarium austroafricanum]
MTPQPPLRGATGWSPVPCGRGPDTAQNFSNPRPKLGLSAVISTPLRLQSRAADRLKRPPYPAISNHGAGSPPQATGEGPELGARENDVMYLMDASSTTTFMATSSRRYKTSARSSYLPLDDLVLPSILHHAPLVCARDVGIVTALTSTLVIIGSETETLRNVAQLVQQVDTDLCPCTTIEWDLTLYSRVPNPQ